jgi:hypothetical protein
MRSSPDVLERWVTGGVTPVHRTYAKTDDRDKSPWRADERGSAQNIR